jgi:3',5'-cyclic AMP phosphodiesterase CpdA
MRAENSKKLLASRQLAFFKRLCFVLMLGAMMMVFARVGNAQVTIAQISDTHLGESQAPNAFDNLRRAVDMVNARHPDAVIVSGDIGENPGEWERARGILKWLHAPVYYAPGNHDVHSRDVDRYRRVFGPDYYRFQVKGVTFLVINSQLLGNFDQFDAQSPQPLPPETEAESEKMLAWLSRQGQEKGNIVIGIQHIPAFRDDKLLRDPKPYWVINEPYRSREMALLHKLGVRHMLVGHWHVGETFERDGVTWHVAPSTGRLLPWSGQLGFAMHTISREGEVTTEFVPLGVGN